MAAAPLPPPARRAPHSAQPPRGANARQKISRAVRRAPFGQYVRARNTEV
jgi:hypothetical protein